MRNVIEKRKSHIKDGSTLSTFIDNLAFDGSYTYDENILKASFKCLPHHMRDADLTMIAGAYKESNIAMMDKLGNIVNLEFASDFTSYNTDNFVDVLPSYPELTKRINNISGYLITAKNDKALSTSGTTQVDGFTNLSVGVFKEASGSAGHRIIRLNRLVERNGTILRYNLVIKYDKDVSNTSPRFLSCNVYGNSFVEGSGTTNVYYGVSFDLTLKKIVNQHSSVISSQAFEISPNTFYITFDLQLRNDGTDINIPQFGFSLRDSNSIGHSGMVGDGLSIITLYYLGVNTNNSYNLVNASTNLQSFENLTSFITLEKDSIIHIKTAKGVQDFILPAGNFNINDYVVNDKLICFAIKYIPNIEDFINNLTLDGTYTFDDVVIRDSWNDLMNRISTNSTLLHQFCNADHIVLPYAYKVGYVAAMDLSDGSIVDIEFERGSTRYRIFDDVIDTPINVIRLDNICYDELIGYTFEEETNYIAGSRPYGGNNLTSTIGTSVMGNPSTFYETSANSQKYTHWDASSSWSGMNSKDVTLNLIIKPVNFSGRYILLLFGEPSISNQGIVFDLENNIPVNISSYVVNSKIRLLQNGFRFINVTFKNVNKPPLNYTFFRFYPRLNTAFTIQSFVGDPTKGFEIANMSVGNSESESVHIAHIANGVNTKHKDHLKTESYSKICTVGVRTGMKVGSYTDPQTLVQNDKINYILLKQ